MSRYNDTCVWHLWQETQDWYTYNAWNIIPNIVHDIWVWVCTEIPMYIHDILIIQGVQRSWRLGIDQVEP